MYVTPEMYVTQKMYVTPENVCDGGRCTLQPSVLRTNDANLGSQTDLSIMIHVRLDTARTVFQFEFQFVQVNRYGCSRTLFEIV